MSEPPVETISVPLLGRIAAGVPIDAIEHVEQVLELDPALVGAGGAAVFALNVEGDSMIDDAILDGDVILVRQQATAPTRRNRRRDGRRLRDREALFPGRKADPLGRLKPGHGRYHPSPRRRHERQCSWAA